MHRRYRQTNRQGSPADLFAIWCAKRIQKKAGKNDIRGLLYGKKESQEQEV